MNLGDLSWRCHVCGETRPDAAISVLSVPTMLAGGVTATQNIRYCNDRAACIEGAPKIDLFAKTAAHITTAAGTEEPAAANDVKVTGEWNRPMDDLNRRLVEEANLLDAAHRWTMVSVACAFAMLSSAAVLALSGVDPILSLAWIVCGAIAHIRKRVLVGRARVLRELREGRLR